MLCPHCEDANDVFSDSTAKQELDDYRKNGARKTTRVLIDTLKQLGISGLSLLDIGGGVGAIPHELLNMGLASATDIDASRAYIQASQQEAKRQGHEDKISYRYGDFVQLAPELDAADIVTLDRVVCCYPDVEALVQLSAERAKQFYALIYPRDNWLFKAAIPLVNFLAFRLSGSAFRTYIHDSQMIDKLIRNKGLSPFIHRKLGLWQVFVYRR